MTRQEKIKQIIKIVNKYDSVVYKKDISEFMKDTIGLIHEIRFNRMSHHKDYKQQLHLATWQIEDKIRDFAEEHNIDIL